MDAPVLQKNLRWLTGSQLLLSMLTCFGSRLLALSTYSVNIISFSGLWGVIDVVFFIYKTQKWHSLQRCKLSKGQEILKDKPILRITMESELGIRFWTHQDRIDNGVFFSASVKCKWTRNCWCTDCLYILYIVVVHTIYSFSCQL